MFAKLPIPPFAFLILFSQIWLIIFYNYYESLAFAPIFLIFLIYFFKGVYLNSKIKIDFKKISFENDYRSENYMNNMNNFVKVKIAMFILIIDKAVMNAVYQ